MQFWQALSYCVENQLAIIVQAANTGLTEGSTPTRHNDRDIVIINTMSLKGVIVADNHQQILAYPGSTLFELEQALAPHGRAPHSVIGSSCLGASVMGGIANNSGGALVKRGPAYTELALYGRVNEQGKLELINHLDIPLSGEPETILDYLDTHPDALRKALSGATQRKASASDYEQHVRDVKSSVPARYNADPNRLYEASGCAGKVAIFAARLDTFPVAQQEQTFYIGTNSPAVLARLRYQALQSLTHLPDVAEYMHRDCFTMAKNYGKDTFLSVQKLGTQKLPGLFKLKSQLDRVRWLPRAASDRLLQTASRLFPQHLPEQLLDYELRFEHHLIIKSSDAGIAEMRNFLHDFFANEDGEFNECNAEESQGAMLNRFAAAGAALRYYTLNQHRLSDILALDIALPRNTQDWFESLPTSIAKTVDKALYYGHFFCHVLHQDYLIKKEYDANDVKQAMLAELDRRQAKYPAEHNVGHLYKADENLKAHYDRLDPTNTFNPGIGKTPRHYRGCC